MVEVVGFGWLVVVSETLADALSAAVTVTLPVMA